MEFFRVISNWWRFDIQESEVILAIIIMIGCVYNIWIVRSIYTDIRKIRARITELEKLHSGKGKPNAL